VRPWDQAENTWHLTVSTIFFSVTFEKGNDLERTVNAILMG
jgi:hypothetical protein